MKKIIKFLILPFFPDYKDLKKQWWHKLAKIIVLITSISSFFALFWIASLFYFNFPKIILDIMYWISWLPVNFANLFSYLPVYGILFQHFLRASPLGPFTLIVGLIIAFYFFSSLFYRLILVIAYNFHLMRVRILFPILVVILILSSVYTSKFREVVNEGSNLIDEHCIKVNPLIIDRKNKFTEEYNVMLSNSGQDKYIEALNNYRKSAVAYINEEKLWLSKYKTFIESNTFNLLMPLYVKEASKYQYQMYEGQYNSAVYMERAWDEKDQALQLDLSNKVIEETKKSNKATDKYNALWDSDLKIHWMFYLIKTPPSKCPAENYNIPDVPNPFAPPAPPVSDQETMG